MQKKILTVIACGLAAGVLLATSVSAQDGKAAFEKRRDTMKEMGRNFYGGIGRVVQGRTEYGPDTVTAAEAVAKLTPTIGTLFPAGSIAEGSRLKPELLAAPDKVTQLAAAVQATIPTLVAEVKSGDKERMAAAYAATGKACNACHDDYRIKQQ